ncbi:MAG: DUF11 domain-containing protein, partial [Planctomycetaceae bacterium]|nr:DUF11 domain-containing protein [Planctomycetaceae bacterium]
MERYLTKLISVKFAAGIFAILFGLNIFNPMTFAQSPKLLPLPPQPVSTSAMNYTNSDTTNNSVNNSATNSTSTPPISTTTPTSSNVLSKSNSPIVRNSNVSTANIQTNKQQSIQQNIQQNNKQTKQNIQRNDNDYYFNALGQKETKKSAGLFERIRRTILGDDSEEENNDDTNNVNNDPNNINRTRPIAPAQPITPPKPATVSLKDLQPDAPTINDPPSNDSPSRVNSPTLPIRTGQSARVAPIGDGYFDNNGEKTSYERLMVMRNEIFSPMRNVERNSNENDPYSNRIDRNSYPAAPRPNGEPQDFYDDSTYNDFQRTTPARPNYRQEQFEPNIGGTWNIEAGNRQPFSPSSQNSPYERTTLHRTEDELGVATSGNHLVKGWNIPAAPSHQTAGHSTHIGANVSSGNRQPADQKAAISSRKLTVSPLIEVETEGESRVIVGRESKYRIRVSNKGGASAEQVTLTIEIPSWIKFSLSALSSGVTEIKKENAKSGSRDFIWTIGQLESNKEELLELLLTPQERKVIDLKILYDFHKPHATTTILVEEAAIEMELQGPNEIMWGTQVAYTLFVRNIGSGDAEKVKLELLETGSAMKEHTFPLIKAGEEKAIAVDVWAGKQQRSVDINIQANGSYGVNAKIAKKVKILRPEVTMQVETAETQFVGSPAEFIVKIKNSGNADAKNLDLTVTIPIGAKYISSTNGGELTPQNNVKWSIDTLP